MFVINGKAFHIECEGFFTATRCYSVRRTLLQDVTSRNECPITAPPKSFKVIPAVLNGMVQEFNGRTEHISYQRHNSIF